MRDKYQRITSLTILSFCTMSIIVRQQHDTHGGLKTDLRDFLGVKADMPEPVKEGKPSKTQAAKNGHLRA
jgi:hypothetical protein